MPWAVNLLLALQFVGCSILALHECLRAEDRADRLVMAGVTAVMLAMAAGALAGL